VKRGLNLDRVVLLGRTFDEYRRYFGLDPHSLRGKRILDVASGVSSFCAEGHALGLDVTAADPIYAWPAERIEKQCGPDLDHVVAAVKDLTVYRWDFYKSRENLRVYREKAYRTFLADFTEHPERYIAKALPHLPFPDRHFDLSLVSYLLFVYEEQLSYEFHRDSLREIMRVTSGEARMYPIVTFEAERSAYIDRLKRDPLLAEFAFEEVQTDFEFLRNSNWYLRITRKS
jgi:hypothetical protein